MKQPEVLINMGLKKANLEFIDKFGNSVNRTLTIKDVVFKYEDARVEVIYRSRPTDTEKALLSEDTFLSHSFEIDMTNENDMNMILSASDRIWELADEEPIVEVPEIEDGKRKVVRKSLKDIGVITDAIK